MARMTLTGLNRRFEEGAIKRDIVRRGMVVPARMREVGVCQLEGCGQPIHIAPGQIIHSVRLHKNCRKLYERGKGKLVKIKPKSE